MMPKMTIDDVFVFPDTVVTTKGNIHVIEVNILITKQA